jgi:hypothetical protein
MKGKYYWNQNILEMFLPLTDHTISFIFPIHLIQHKKVSTASFEVKMIRNAILVPSQMEESTIVLNSINVTQGHIAS